MASWSQFAETAPTLAEEVRELFYQYGSGFGYLATIRRDGGPRLHPVSPVIADGGLFCFVLNSPKRRDLERNGWYALHAYPPENSNDEAYLTGHAYPVTDRRRVGRLVRAHRAAGQVDWRLFELDIEVAMVTRHAGRDRAQSYHIWHAVGPAAGTMPERRPTRIRPHNHGGAARPGGAPPPCRPPHRSVRVMPSAGPSSPLTFSPTWRGLPRKVAKGRVVAASGAQPASRRRFGHGAR